MNSAICTLFENHHHYGFGALANSLYRHGFRGSVYAGYRGSLPPWSKGAKQNPLLAWEGAYTYHAAEGLSIHFLPLNTSYHFAQCKPTFMLQLWEGLAKDADAMVYFDPDITIKCAWTFFESWMSYGVAMIHENVGSDMSPTHPKRKEWEKIIFDSNRKPTRELYNYINSGFCGVSRLHKEFLNVWVDIFETGLKTSRLTPDKWRHSRDSNYAFYNQDQDIMNAVAMCSESPISEMGPEAMDFLPGGNIMSHSIGYLKPWTKKFIKLALKGRAPSAADRNYWMYVESPILLFDRGYIKKKKRGLAIASFIGRFYRRY